MIILESLVDFHEAQLRDKVLRDGWETANLSFGLDLTRDGHVSGLIDLRDETEKGKKVPAHAEMPARYKRGVKIRPNAFVDTSTYILGRAEKKDEETQHDIDRQAACFAASGEFHRKLLVGCDSPAAEAVLLYFALNTPEHLAADAALADNYELLISSDGGNIALCFEGMPIYLYPEIAEKWDEYFAAQMEPDEEPNGVSIISGKLCVIARTHPAVRHMAGGLFTGNSLCSANLPCFCHYGYKQGENYPCSNTEAFAYTSALNYLVQHKEHCVVLDNVSVLLYSRSRGLCGNNAKFIRACLGLSGDGGYAVSDKDLQCLTLGRELSWNGGTIVPDEKMSVLMLVPNYARIAPIDYRELTMREIARNTLRYRDVVQFVKGDPPTVARMVSNSVSRVSDKAHADVNIIRSCVWAIIGGDPLSKGVGLSVISQIQTGTLKLTPEIQKMIILANAEGGRYRMSLDSNYKNPAYLTGRLLAICDSAEYAAYAGQNSKPTSFFDRNRSTILSQPKRALTISDEAMRGFVAKLHAGHRDAAGTYYSKLFTEILDEITPEELENWPTALSANSQTQLVLGFAHEKAWLIEQSRKRKAEAEAEGAEDEIPEEIE